MPWINFKVNRIFNILFMFISNLSKLLQMSHFEIYFCSLVSDLLANSGLSFTHLNAETPAENKLTEKDPHW
jgi:hypothetical protein